MPADLRRDLLIQWDGAPPLEGAQFIRSADTAAARRFDGLWPGIRKPPNVDGRGDETVSASVEPWVDANGYLAACGRALSPSKAALIAPEAPPDDRVVPYDSLELALIEARVCGGNAILAPDKRLREDLAAHKPEAETAWRSLAATARWLKENEHLLGRPAIPSITLLIEDGADSHTLELANLLFRRNGSPDVSTPAALPAPSPARMVVVAAGLRAITPDLAARLLAHARAGATVVTDDSAPSAWWRRAAGKLQKTQEDREFYPVGKGLIAAYKEKIADPSEFALDCIDLVGHPRRAVRLWNAGSVVPITGMGPGPRQAVLHAINYGGPIDIETQVRVRGIYTRASLLAPGESRKSLECSKRGETTEVMIPKIRRLATVVFG